MSCRSTNVGSAAVSIAQQATGLDTRQVTSTFHQIKREFESCHLEDPDPQHDIAPAVVEHLEISAREMRDDGVLSEARHRSIANRLNMASREGYGNDRALWLSARQLIQRTRTYADNLDGFTNEYARRLGIPREVADQIVSEYKRYAEDHASDETLNQPLSSSPDDVHRGSVDFPPDKITRYVTGVMAGDIEAADDANRSSSYPSTNLQMINIAPNDAGVTALGYNSFLGRLEVQLQDRPGVMAYRGVSAAEYEALREDPARYGTHIRGRWEHLYRTVQEAERSGMVRNCPTCGQFVGAANPHECPLRGTPEAVDAFVNTDRVTPESSPEAPAAVPAAWEAADGQLTREDITEAVEQVSVDLAADLDASRSAQNQARDRWEPTNSYTDDHEAFQADYRAAKERKAAGEPIPYMMENALDGLGDPDGGRGFGIEIEFDLDWEDGDVDDIAAELHEAGLTGSRYQNGYHGNDGNYSTSHQGGWRFEEDDTVSGGEIISPIMYDTRETWENIAKVCEIVKRNGGRATVNAGAHVNVSADNYNHTVENYNRLMGLYAENEDLLYRLASDPGRGSHRGQSWCSPNRVPSEGYRDVYQARNGGAHGNAVNLSHADGLEGSRIEYRLWDSSLDPGTIQSQIKVSVAMTEAAFRDTEYEPTGQNLYGSRREYNRNEHGMSRQLTGQAWRDDVAGYKRFADRLFRRDEDKAQVTSLFALNRWPGRLARRNNGSDADG